MFHCAYRDGGSSLHPDGSRLSDDPDSLPRWSREPWPKPRFVLRSAFVDVRWRQCTGLAPDEACSSRLALLELLLVVRVDAPCEDSPATLGKAFVARDAGGVFANVYFNCVEWLAMSTGTDVAVLLGRVAAHELGHLMMHTTAHARRGLMRSNWTPHEVRRNYLRGLGIHG